MLIGPVHLQSGQCGWYPIGTDATCLHAFVQSGAGRILSMQNNSDAIVIALTRDALYAHNDVAVWETANMNLGFKDWHQADYVYGWLTFDSGYRVLLMRRIDGGWMVKRS